ncbi:hypothetical protein JCM8547_004345 [Rhodosporidiobolus lusitaniae]
MSSLSSHLQSRRIPPHLPRDILAFLLSYPSLRPSPGKNANALFYLNQHPALPRRVKCEELQRELEGNWNELEHRHDFVQWLFPIREQGVNWDAQPLELHEVDTIKKDPKAMDRLLDSYRLLLSFYGLRLVCPSSGELALEDSVPAPSPASFVRRFQNLERNPHNYLRITRILKCLGEFGLPQHPPSFLLFILSLQSPPPPGNPSKPTYLTSPALVRSMDTYWRYCVRDDEEREFVVGKVEEVRAGKKGAWGEEEYRRWVRERRERRERGGKEGKGEKGREE